MSLLGELSSKDSQIKNKDQSIGNLQSNIDALIHEMEEVQLSRDQCKKDNQLANEKIMQLES